MTAKSDSEAKQQRIKRSAVPGYTVQHYPQAQLKWTRDPDWLPKSQTRLSRHERPSDAAIFIHGWGGDSGVTWANFPQFVGSLKETSRADLFFLEYPTLQSQVPFCAAQFRKFLVDLLLDPIDSIINPSLPACARKRNDDLRYQRIYMIGHSMGAVVARRALLDLDQAPPHGLSESDFKKFKLLFFAPAHSGSTIPLLIGSGLGLDFFGVKALGSAVRFWFQSLRDLEEGSPFLRKLAEDCRLAREARTARHAPIDHLRAVVYHAQNDRVVSQNDFDNDYPFNPVMNQNHRTICKPSNVYHDPVEAFRGIFGK